MDLSINYGDIYFLICVEVLSIMVTSPVNPYPLVMMMKNGTPLMLELSHGSIALVIQVYSKSSTMMIKLLKTFGIKWMSSFVTTKCP